MLWCVAALACAGSALGSKQPLQEQAAILLEFKVGAMDTPGCLIGAQAPAPPIPTRLFATWFVGVRHARRRGRQAPCTAPTSTAPTSSLARTNSLLQEVAGGAGSLAHWEGDNPCNGMWEGVICNEDSDEVVSL